MLAAASLLVLAIPFVDDWVLDKLVAWDPGPRLNPLLATIFLFGAQSVILGTVSPIAVRLKAHSLDELGRTAGRLFAISTAGSIAGTFATAFWLIPELGTDQVLAVGRCGADARGRRRRFRRAAGARRCGRARAGGREPRRGRLAGAGHRAAPSPPRSSGTGRRSTGSSATRSGSARSRTRSPATRSCTRRTRSTTGSRWSRTTTAATSASTARSRAACTRTTRTGRASSTPTTCSCRSPTGRRTRRILYIGLGGGSAPKRTWRDFPATRIDVVELDPEVVDVAYEYFDVPRDPRLRVEVEDGRRFLATHDGPWDAIVIDAFYSDSIPFHLATREFLELARSRLAPGGTVSTNIIGAVRGPESRLFRSMLRTYRAVFPTVAIHPVRGEGETDLDGHPQHHPRRRRGRGAVEGVPPGALGRAAEAVTGRARPHRRRSAAASTPPSRPRTCRS